MTRVELEVGAQVPPRADVLKGMKRIAALLLALTGCAVGSPRDSAAPENAYWVEPSSPLYEAQQTWGLPLPDGAALVALPAEAFLANCTALEGYECPATILGVTDQAGHRILIRNDASAQDVRFTVLHEMGHLLRGNGGHIDAPECGVGSEPGAYVMCAHGRSNADNTVYIPEPTPEDFDFVLGVSSPETASR